VVDTRKWIVTGVDQFNRLEFMEAHDSWEHIWMEEGDEEAVFAQGLIQLAAAYLHIRRGTSPGGTLRLFNSAIEKLAPYGPEFCGVDRSRVIAAAAQHRERLEREGAVKLTDGEYPKLEMLPETN
jgi:predicted metal-dependent hydrolase